MKDNLHLQPLLTLWSPAYEPNPTILKYKHCPLGLHITISFIIIFTLPRDAILQTSATQNETMLAIPNNTTLHEES